MITLHFHLIPQYKYELFHIHFTISEVIVRGKRIKHNWNWFYFNFSVERPSFKLNNFKTEKFKLTFEG